MDRNTRVLICIGSALGRDGVGFVGWVPRVNIAILENYGRVAKNKVYCPVNVAVFIKLAVRVNVEGVLVAFEGTLVKY